jgi:hypothetical protein
MEMPDVTAEPSLRTDWAADTPATDTYLRRFVSNWTAAVEAEGVPLGGRTLRRDDLAAVDVGRPADPVNVATLLAPLFPDDVDRVMSTLDDFYGFRASAKSGGVTLFSPWPTPDLSSHGWSLLDYQPLMLRPPGGATPSPPPDLRIEPVRSEGSLRAFEETILRGFWPEESTRPAPGTAVSPRLVSDDRLHLWVGWEDERPVCAASAFVAAGITNVTLVATVPEARRRGYGAAVTWRATLADPARPAMLLATDQGRPLYERMGYLPLFRFTLWHRDRPG